MYVRSLKSSPLRKNSTHTKRVFKSEMCSKNSLTTCTRANTHTQAHTHTRARAHTHICTDKNEAETRQRTCKEMKETASVQSTKGKRKKEKETKKLNPPPSFPTSIYKERNRKSSGSRRYDLFALPPMNRRRLPTVETPETKSAVAATEHRHEQYRSNQEIELY